MGFKKNFFFKFFICQIIAMLERRVLTYLRSRWVGWVDIRFGAEGGRMVSVLFSFWLLHSRQNHNFVHLLGYYLPLIGGLCHSVSQNFFHCFCPLLLHFHHHFDGSFIPRLFHSSHCHHRFHCFALLTWPRFLLRLHYLHLTLSSLVEK